MYFLCVPVSCLLFIKGTSHIRSQFLVGATRGWGFVVITRKEGTVLPMAEVVLLTS